MSSSPRGVPEGTSAKSARFWMGPEVKRPQEVKVSPIPSHKNRRSEGEWDSPNHGAAVRLIFTDRGGSGRFCMPGAKSSRAAFCSEYPQRAVQRCLEDGMLYCPYADLLARDGPVVPAHPPTLAPGFLNWGVTWHSKLLHSGVGQMHRGWDEHIFCSIRSIRATRSTTPTIRTCTTRTIRNLNTYFNYLFACGDRIYS